MSLIYCVLIADKLFVKSYYELFQHFKYYVDGKKLNKQIIFMIFLSVDQQLKLQTSLKKVSLGELLVVWKIKASFKSFISSKRICVCFNGESSLKQTRKLFREGKQDLMQIFEGKSASFDWFAIYFNCQLLRKKTKIFSKRTYSQK